MNYSTYEYELELLHHCGTTSYITSRIIVPDDKDVVMYISWALLHEKDVSTYVIKKLIREV